MEITITDICKKILHIIFSRNVFFIYECAAGYAKSLPDGQKNDLTIERVKNENLMDVCSFRPQCIVKNFQDFLDNGDIGYYGYIDGKCVHHTWVQNGAREINDLGYRMKIQEDSVYIHYCQTAPEARGKGIYPKVLACVCKDFFDKNKYLIVLKRKGPANRGVEKAGFIKKKWVSITRFLGIRWIKEEVL